MPFPFRITASSGPRDQSSQVPESSQKSHISSMASLMHIRYAQEFEDQSLGHALLHPSSTLRLHPGVCGYFDDEGDWRTIVDIPKIKTEVSTKPEDLNFTSLEGTPVLPEAITMNWEPKCSSDVKYHKVDAKASAGYACFVCSFTTM